MKNLSPWEKSVIEKLVSINPEQVTSVQVFLESFYFTEALGRALILQNLDSYAVLFLKNTSFNNTTVKNTEIQDFFQLMRLLHYLNEKGYITIYGNDYRKMYLIQDDFNEGRVEKNTIVLNAKGYYTDSPKAVYDKKGQVIYQGILMKFDQYKQILNIVTGNLIISVQLISYVNEYTQPSTPMIAETTVPVTKTGNSLTFKNFLTISVTVLTILILVFGGYFIYLRFFSPPETNQGDIIHGTQLKKVVKSAPEYSGIPVIENPDAGVIKPYYGIDISHYNGSEVSRVTENDSLRFVICKATEGTTFIDPYFDVNWQLVKSKKILVGAYHFYRVDHDPVEQAEFFLKTMETKGKTDIAPVVDIEDGSIPNGLHYEPAYIQKNLIRFLQHIESKTSRQPIIYTGGYFANQYLTNDTLGNYRLWLADYTQGKPRIPNSWKQKGYFIWQKSDEYPIGSQYTDLDFYLGSIEDLTQ